MHKLEALAHDNAAQLARTTASLKDALLMQEAESAKNFKKMREDFNQQLDAFIAEQLAKVEAKREQMKQLALAAPAAPAARRRRCSPSP